MDYKFKITYKGKTIARSSTLANANKRYREILNYNLDETIIIGRIKNFDSKELKLEEIGE